MKGENRRREDIKGIIVTKLLVCHGSTSSGSVLRVGYE